MANSIVMRAMGACPEGSEQAAGRFALCDWLFHIVEE
jgi:hypothetical protein